MIISGRWSTAGLATLTRFWTHRRSPNSRCAVVSSDEINSSYIDCFLTSSAYERRVDATPIGGSVLGGANITKLNQPRSRVSVSCVDVSERGGRAPWEGGGAAEGGAGLGEAGSALHAQGAGGDGGALREDEERPAPPAAHQLLVRRLVLFCVVVFICVFVLRFTVASHSPIHTPTAVSTMQGNNQHVRSS